MFDHDRAFTALARRLGLTLSDVRGRILHSGLREQFEVGAITPQEFHQRVMALFPGATIPQRDFARYWSDIFWPNEPMIATLSRIREQIPLALLSNTDALHFGYVERHYPEVVALFDGRLALSYEVKAAKPDRAIYQRALELVGCADDPASCLYMDDIADYVAGAARAGMRAVQYRDHAEWMAWLREAGLDG